MLRLDDRLRVAMGADMGAQLSPKEVVMIAGWLVTLRRIAEGKTGPGSNHLAKDALGEFAPQK